MSKDVPPPYSPAPPPPGFVQPPPPPSGYHMPPEMPQHQHPQVIIHTVHRATPLGPTSQLTVCPSCHAEISTIVRTEPGTKTHIFALILCLLQCYLCCCIPYCVDSCQSQKHYCPNCNAYLGAYEA